MPMLICRLENGLRVGEENSRWKNKVFPSLIAIMQDPEIVKVSIMSLVLGKEYGM